MRAARGLGPAAAAVVAFLSMAIPPAATAQVAFTVTLDAPRAAGPLSCPSRAAPASYGAAPAYPRAPERAELGPLAETVIRPPPRLDLPGLQRLFTASAERPFRIGWWGDSHVSAGPLARTLAERLGAGSRAGAGNRTVAPDWLPPTIGRANVRLIGLADGCIGPGWSSALAFQSPEDMAVGPGLINRTAAGGPDSWIALDFRAKTPSGAPMSPVMGVDLLYRAPAGTRLSIAVNDGPATAVAGPAGTGPDRLALRAPGPIETLRITVLSGPFELQGLQLSRAQTPAVALDVFGLPGSTARGWARVDGGWLSSMMSASPFDLVVLQYGTNETLDDPTRYRAEVEAAVDRLRHTFPGAACLLVGPPDRGVTRASPGERVDLLSHSRALAMASEVQARVAAASGCGFWDWRGMMGGDGGAYGWFNAAPPLMGPDLTHLTPAGYRLTADALARSLGF